MAQLEVVVWDRSEGAPERQWEVVQTYLQSTDPPTVTVVHFTLDKQVLMIDGDASDGDLVMVCGTYEHFGHPDTLYRVYVARNGKLQEFDWKDSRWALANMSGVIGYNPDPAYYPLDPGSPCLLEAVAENWTWEDHFGAVRAMAGDRAPGIDWCLQWCEEPAAARGVLNLLIQLIQGREQIDQLREQQAQDAARIEELTGAIRDIGKQAYGLCLDHSRSDLGGLVKQKDLIRGAALRSLDKIWGLYRLCARLDTMWFGRMITDSRSRGERIIPGVER